MSTNLFQMLLNLEDAIGADITNIHHHLFVDNHQNVLDLTTKQIRSNAFSGGKVSQLGHVVLVDDDVLESLHCGNTIPHRLGKVNGKSEKLGVHN